MADDRDEEKRRKAEAKQQIKDLKKQQKENKKEIGRIKEEAGQPGGVGLIIFLVILFILILLALIKLDVGGFGSNVLGPVIGDIPYVQKILPKSAQRESIFPSADASAEATEEEPKKKKEETTEAATTQAPKKDTKKDSKSGSSTSKKKKASTPKVDSSIQNLADTYAAMETSKAAADLEMMAGDYKLVAKILLAMEPTKRSEILAAMSTEHAAKISKIMSSM